MDLLSVKQRFGIIGNSPLLNRALEIAVRVASTDLSVLVTGESGVGKEFFPQVIHAYSPRKHSKYIVVNCGAIPEGTIDSELFGHEKNSFTGAAEARKGYFEEADGGTIFLDEVGELPQSTQVRLLRVLQTGEFLRVGSSITKKVNVRVVAATNANMQSAIDAGRFREDLFYRLNTVPISIPSLRERKEDIHLIFRKFATDIATQYRMPAISLEDGARALLENYQWPGNIRQLKSVVGQISAIEENRVVDSNIMRKYLPNSPSRVPMVMNDGGSKDLSDERDLLYKVLFDIKSDINKLKMMVGELMPDSKFESKFESKFDAYKSDVTALLPSAFHPTHEDRALPMKSEPMFVDSEEVIYDSEPPVEMTKEQAQREVIVKALKRNNGKRKEAAKELFISERTLYRKIKDLNINEF